MSAKAFHDPHLDGFQPTSTYEVMGVSYMHLEQEDSVQLELSKAGLEFACEYPRVLNLLERMGRIISRHDRYVAPDSSDSEDTVEIFLQSSLNPQSNPRTHAEEMHLSSVYHPNSAPETVVKAYDHEPRLAPAQFYNGNWLHQGSAEGSSVYFPMQLAMFTAPASGHKTTVMEYVDGISMPDLRALLEADHSEEEIDEYVVASAAHAQAEIRRALGTKALGILNDLNMPDTNNIIIDDKRPIDISKPGDQRLTVIDQPKYTSPMQVAKLSLARKLSSKSWQKSLAVSETAA